jgi:hypothetical protein
MAVRTQIGLSAEDHRRAKRRAAELDISLAEYIRRLVARDLGEPRSDASPELLFNLGRSEGSDIARHKDEYIGDAIESLRPSRGED